MAQGGIDCTRTPELWSTEKILWPGGFREIVEEWFLKKADDTVVLAAWGAVVALRKHGLRKGSAPREVEDVFAAVKHLPQYRQVWQVWAALNEVKQAAARQGMLRGVSNPWNTTPEVRFRETRPVYITRHVQHILGERP